MVRNKNNNGEVLTAIHNKLIDELAAYEDYVCNQRDDVTEAHERYLRVLVLMIKSLEALERLDANQKTKHQDTRIEDQIEKCDEIQRRLARLAAAQAPNGVLAQFEQ